MAKDTIIPIKFNRELTYEEIEAFVDHVHQFAESLNIEANYVTHSAVARRVASRAVKSKKAPELSPHVTLNTYQLCPKCNGQGTVSKPPYVAGDIHQWTSSATSFVCDVCNGAKIIPLQCCQHCASGQTKTFISQNEDEYKFHDIVFKSKPNIPITKQ